MAENRDKICYELLMQVFRDHAYASIALNAALKSCAENDKAYITRLFYGVLERSVYYDYVLAAFSAKKPKKSVATIIKMGYYMLENTDMPAYAAVDNTVKLCKAVGKEGVVGFVNSALRKFAAPPFPTEGSAEWLSVHYSYPLWLVRKLADEYGFEFTEEMLDYVPSRDIHVRVNTKVIDTVDFEKKYARLFDRVARTPVGYLIPRKTLDEMESHDYVVQSASSIAAVHAYLYGVERPKNILDVCAAPGGKSVLLALVTNAEITACDIHSHRVELIKKYADNCKVSVKAVEADAMVFNPEWHDAFDLVVCDVPCSGLGVVSSKPDILYNRSEEDIEELKVIQRAILENASKYVRAGGRLCYSTCTILKEENGDIIADFLSKHGEFAREKIRSPYDECEKDAISLFPHLHGTDGFYVAALKRIK